MSAPNFSNKLHVKARALPRKKLTFLIVPENADKVTEFSLSTAWVGLIACVVVLFTVGLTVIISDYARLKKNSPSRTALTKEVTEQRAQIQVFAKKIQTLNEELMTLRDLERKIPVSYTHLTLPTN